MDKRLKTVIALSIASLILLTVAWALSNKIAEILPTTAAATTPLINT